MLIARRIGVAGAPPITDKLCAAENSSLEYRCVNSTIFKHGCMINSLINLADIVNRDWSFSLIHVAVRGIRNTCKWLTTKFFEIISNSKSFG
ncbi:hypothetical protein PVAND_017669 [Polypedilum vanderplanki]|uniref:Uncharacterized protein n=1 Tax=Polypedilum vanderplanki TaxID=319348 RepID=A0A9J6B8T3_POLVA|nr:hypothetical protein PVAND_017669 [Polypedilum vanderplanki]